MSDDAARPEQPTAEDEDPHTDVPDRAELTSPSGTPVPVDITRDLQSRSQWVVLLGGPVIWAVHFAVVYFVAEAGCNGAGDGLEQLGPPVPALVTLVATLVAAPACLGVAWWGWNRIPGGPGGQAATDPAAHERHRVLSTIGAMLALISLAAVLFVAASAAWLPC